MLTRRAALALFPLVATLRAATALEVKTLEGKPLTITPGANHVTVVVFYSTQCPISNDYNDRLSDLVKLYSPRGVNFYVINANSTESIDMILEHRKSAGFVFPIYKDVNAAERLSAQVTPESFVFDRSGNQIYQGYIDDARNVARITDHGLRNAIEAALAGKPAPKAQTRAFGCTIKKFRRNS